MNTTKFLLVLFVAWLAVAVASQGAVAPAGTVLVIRTDAAISSHAKPGNYFSCVLDQPVVAKGTVLLPTGTQMRGIITTSRGARYTTRSEPLTLNLTEVAVNGRLVPIKTKRTEPDLAKTTRESRGHFTVGESVLPPRTRLHFQLSQPVNL